MTEKERSAVLEDLRQYRLVAASCRRNALALAKHAADLALDFDTARYHERLAARMRREAQEAHERRWSYIATIRELERSLA